MMADHQWLEDGFDVVWKMMRSWDGRKLLCEAKSQTETKKSIETLFKFMAVDGFYSFNAENHSIKSKSPVCSGNQLDFIEEIKPNSSNPFVDSLKPGKTR